MTIAANVDSIKAWAHLAELINDQMASACPGCALREEEGGCDTRSKIAIRCGLRKYEGSHTQPSVG